VILCGVVNKGLYIYGKDGSLVVSETLINIYKLKMVYQYKGMKEDLGNHI